MPASTRPAKVVPTAKVAVAAAPRLAKRSKPAKSDASAEAGAKTAAKAATKTVAKTAGKSLAKAAATLSSPMYFASPEEFGAWLRQHGAAAPELLVGFHKRGSGTPSMTWPESVDEALCVGWIDGVRKRIDDQRYTIRFTPRKKTSIWSAINIERVRVLTEQGRMTPAGLAAFGHRQEAKSRTYSYEQAVHAELTPQQEATFKKHQAAWTFFNEQTPRYRHQMIWRVQSARQPATQERRLALLIEACEERRRLD